MKLTQQNFGDECQNKDHTVRDFDSRTVRVPDIISSRSTVVSTSAMDVDDTKFRSSGDAQLELLPLQSFESFQS